MKKKLLIVTLCAALLLNFTAPRTKAFDLVITPTAVATALAVGAAAGLVITKGDPVTFYNEKIEKYTSEFGNNLMDALNKTKAVSTSGGKALLTIGSVAYAEISTFFSWLTKDLGITEAGQKVEFGDVGGLPTIGEISLFTSAWFNTYHDGNPYTQGTSYAYKSIDPTHFWFCQFLVGGNLYLYMVADDLGRNTPFRFTVTKYAGTESGTDRVSQDDVLTVKEWKTVTVVDSKNEPMNIYYSLVNSSVSFNKRCYDGWHGDLRPYLNLDALGFNTVDAYFNSLHQTVVSVPTTGTLETTDVYDGERSETALGASPLEYVPATNAYDIGANYQIEDIHNWAQELLDAYSRGLADGQVMDIVGTQALAGADAEVVAGQIQFAEDYTVAGLESIFPFCIPFDIVDMFKALQSNRVIPHFELPFRIPGIVDYTIVIDLTEFDDLAQTLRTMELLCFGIALAVATRSKFIRG